LQTGYYLVYATAFDRAGLQGIHVITVDMEVPPTPPNDNFSAAQLLSGLQGTIQGTTAGATREPGEPNHANSPGNASIWYRWVAPENGILTLDTSGSGFDTLLAVYTGTSVSNLTYRESDRGGGIDGGSHLSVTVANGTTYYIAIDGLETQYGNTILSWQFVVDRPVLTIRRATGGNLTISWSAAASGFSLRSASSLSGSPSWQPVGTSPIQQGNEMVVTVPASEAAAFFRLQKP
jgi:hypothetical protein